MKLKENKRDSFENVRIDQCEEDFPNPVNIFSLCSIYHKKATAKIGKVEKSGFF